MDIRFLMLFGYCLKFLGGWVVGMYIYIESFADFFTEWFYTQFWLSQMSAVCKLHCMVIDKSHPLKAFTVVFFILLIFGFEISWNISRLSSQYNHMFDLLFIDATSFKINDPTN